MGMGEMTITDRQNGVGKNVSRMNGGKEKSRKRRNRMFLKQKKVM